MIYHLTDPAGLLGIAAALLLGVVLHNVAQTLAAQAVGDRTPRQSGMLTFNPVRHFTVFGVVAMVLGGYGWPAPVPLAERWRARRFRLIVAVLAGPVVYLLLCVVALVVLRVVPGHGFVPQLLAWAARTEGGLFVLSLIPVPPLDGARVMFALAPATLGWQRARYQLEERNFGQAIALAIVLLPLLQVPSIPRELGDALTNALGRAVGLA